MKVFISSVIDDYKHYRDAAEKAVRTAAAEPLMSEHFGARPYSSKTACLGEIEQSDVYVLILGARYGFEPEPGVSVTQQEFRHAASLGKPVLVFVEQTDMEPAQARFRKEVEDYKAGFHRVSVASPEQFKDELIGALIRLGQVRSACTQAEFESRIAKVSSERERRSFSHSDAATITLAFLPQPFRQVDITRLALDQMFSDACGSGMTHMRDGYKPIEEPEATGLQSGTTTIRYFEDGLFVGRFEPKTSRDGDRAYFADHYLSPSTVLRLTQGCWPLFRALGGWCQIALSGMENRVMQEPPTGESRSYSIPHRQMNTQAISKLLMPCNDAAYTAWTEEVVRRFIRAFGQS